MAGYIRQSSFVDGDTITAALFNNEYNQLVNAFSNTTGHKHDGTTAEGPVIGLIGDAGETSPNNKVLIDTTNNYIEFYVEVSSAPVQQLYIADGAIVPVTDSDVDLGTSSLYFKDTYTDTVTTTGNVTVGGNLTVTGNATISGNLTFGDADTDSINLAAEIDSDIIPNTDGTYDLGSATKEWQDLYIDGTANIDSLVADTADINGGTIDGATIATSDITVGAGKTLDVSSGTLTLADDQISGDKVEGGTIAATTITTLTSTTGNVTNVNATTVDTTNIEVTNIKAKDGTAAGSIADSTGVVTLASSVLTTTDINGGTIDGVTIGGTTAGAVTFTDLSDGTITVTAFVDEDDMTSDSATLIPTQQSVKAYVDSQVTAQDLDFQGDTGGALSIDLDSETLTIAGGTGLDTVGSGNTVTVNIDSTVATLTGTQTLTNKTLTSPVINTGVSGTAVLDDDTFATATATTLATSESIKAYVDTTVAATNEVVEDSTPQLGGDLDTNGNDILFGDNDKAVFGAGSDLQIYHDGSNSRIYDIGTGDLRIQGTNLRLMDANGGNYLYGVQDAEVTLYHNSAAKLATTSTGIDVTGVLSATSISVGDSHTIGNDGFDNLEITSSTSENIVLKPAGSVFLYNAASPVLSTTATGIDVTGTATMDGLTVSNGTNTTAIPATSDRVSFTAGNSYIQSTGSLFVQPTGDLVLNGSGSEIMRIKSGKVGIGNTSPATALDVTGTVTADGLDVSTLSGDATIFLQNVSSGRGMKITKNYDDFSAKFFYSLHPTTEAGSLAFKGSQDSTQLLINSNGDISFYEDTGTTAKLFWDASAESLGIGTSSPSSALHITNATPEIYLEDSNTGAGDAKFLANNGNLGLFSDVNNEFASSVMYFMIDGSERMRIDSSGNIGIGTTSPTSKLHLADTSTVVTFEDTNSTNNSINTITNYEGTMILSVDPNDNSTATESLRFLMRGSEAMRIDSSNNLLVGTTTAGVASSSSVEGIQIAPTTLSVARSGGQVAFFNRQTNDGAIVDFRKDGTTIGSIGSTIGNAYFAGSSTGITFGSANLYPTNASGAKSDDTLILGSATNRFKDLYLSGTAKVDSSAYISQGALTSSSNAVAWDAAAKANAYYATTENTTFSAPTNAVEGAIISVEIAQGATPYTVAWNTVFEFAASTAPTVTATANKTDIFSFRYNGSVWQEIGRTQNMAQT